MRRSREAVPVGHRAAESAVLDGEIACLGNDGRSRFYDLLFRREWPSFVVFDVLMINDEDLTALPLLERKRRLAAVMPRVPSRIVFHDHVAAKGLRLFENVCRQDGEGIIAKWKHGRYHTDGETTSWLKIKNPEYSQIVGRREVFERRSDARRTRRSRRVVPVLCSELAPVAAVLKTV